MPFKIKQKIKMKKNMGLEKYEQDQGVLIKTTQAQQENKKSKQLIVKY